MKKKKTPPQQEAASSRFKHKCQRDFYITEDGHLVCPHCNWEGKQVVPEAMRSMFKKLGQK